MAAIASSSQAILLDGLFNIAYLAAGLFTIRVAALLAGGDDERFPFGYGFFEPLVNGIKGLLVLGVTVMALYGAVQALFTGGREIEAVRRRLVSGRQLLCVQEFNRSIFMYVAKDVNSGQRAGADDRCICVRCRSQRTAIVL